MKTVDEQLASGDVWPHWQDIADFTIDGLRIGARPPSPRKYGRRGASPFDSRLDRRYREIVLVAHALRRAGYEPTAMRAGNPNLGEPDVFADIDGGVWIEHTDLLPEKLAARTENAQLFEVRLRDAIADDHAIHGAIGDRYLTLSFASPPSSKELDDVCAEVMRYLRESADDGRDSFSGVVSDEYILLRRHGLYIQASTIKGQLDVPQRVTVSYGGGTEPLPWPHGPAAKREIEKKRFKKYKVDRPMWLLMTCTNVITISDPTIPLLGKEPLELAPFERFMFLADWSRQLLVDRRADAAS